MEKIILLEAILAPNKGLPYLVNNNSINTLFILKRW